MLKIGLKSSFKKVIEDSDVREFSNISRDRNPIHLDDDYAANTPYRRRIAHGMHIASLISGVLGNDLPGPGSIYLSQNIQFCDVAFIGDEVTVEVEIMEMTRKGVVTLATRCFKQTGDCIVEGTATVKVPRSSLPLELTLKGDTSIV